MSTIKCDIYDNTKLIEWISTNTGCSKQRILLFVIQQIIIIYIALPMSCNITLALRTKKWSTHFFCHICRLKQNYCYKYATQTVKNSRQNHTQNFHHGPLLPFRYGKGGTFQIRFKKTPRSPLAHRKSCARSHAELSHPNLCVRAAH